MRLLLLLSRFAALTDTETLLSINHIRDLYSLLRFLHISGGIEQRDVFDRVITRGLATEDAMSETLLRLLMRDLCLRRKKDMAFVDLRLPPKTEYIHRIALWPDEQKKYDTMLQEAQGAFQDWKARSQHAQKGRFQGVLERLLRLRQM